MSVADLVARPLEAPALYRADDTVRADEPIELPSDPETREQRIGLGLLGAAIALVTTGRAALWGGADARQGGVARALPH